METLELINIVKQCGDLLLKYRNNVDIEFKEDGSIVTKADKEVNQILQDFLKTKYPTYGIMSEELEREHHEYTWYIDPLNGTGAYTKGKDTFNILVGLVKDNTPILGIIYHPTNSKLYIGGQEELPRIIQNEIETPLKKSSYVSENLLFTPSDNWENVFTQLFKNNPEYKLVHINELGDEFKDPRIHIIEGGINLQINSNFGAWGTWDICAGHAILSCFGGIMTDYYGNDIDYSKPMLNDGFIAADTKERIMELLWIKK